ncbi:ester cyclase [Spirillospora albida]|uniref:ester cyclase n=1 Tax=Spirillospora albida TaxID=58123 RepID=UPI0004C226E5|nr:ester cyclase [Spirillospora albida]
MDTLDTLYRRWLFKVWQGGPDVAEEILTPGFVGHWPGIEVHGPREAAEQVRRSHEYFTDVRTSLDAGPVIADGMVAAGWTFHGSYRGGVPGATAEPGTRVAFRGHDIFRAEGDRFAEYWVVSDVMGMMTQLGALGGTPS